jgi:rare lipoprotein A
MGRGLSLLAMLAGAALLAPDLAARPDSAALDSVLDFGEGEASFFGAEMAGNRTANGETCDPETMTAAHRTLPLGSWLRVTDADSGRSVVVRVNDRGPYAKGRVIDLSRAAARELGMLRRGHARVSLRLVGEELAAR